jgi:hypothetical protein
MRVSRNNLMFSVLLISLTPVGSAFASSVTMTYKGHQGVVAKDGEEECPRHAASQMQRISCPWTGQSPSIPNGHRLLGAEIRRTPALDC